MSIKTTITLNNLIAEFQSLCDSHLMIESFHYGNFLTIYQSNKIKYKTLLMNVNNAGVDDHYINLTVELMTMDKVFKDISDRIDVESDTLSILQDVVSVITKSNRWQSFCKIPQQSQMRKFVNKGEDQVTGWAMTLQLSIKRKNGICDLPIENYDYEGEYTPQCAGVSIYEDGIFVEVVPSGGRYDYSTSCDPVNIQINGVDFVEVESGENFDINVVDEDGDNTGSKVGSLYVVPFNKKRVYVDPFYTGQNSSFADGDVYWRKVNNIGNIPSTGGTNQMRLQYGSNVLLVQNNVFGNNYKITGTSGGYYNPVDSKYYDRHGVETTRALAFPNELAIDHLIQRLVQTLQVGTRSWNDWCAYGLTYSNGEFEEFYLPSISEMVYWGNWGLSIGFRDNVPFSWGGGLKVLGETYLGSGTSQCFTAESYAHFRSTPKANNNKAILTKPVDIESIFG